MLFTVRQRKDVVRDRDAHRPAFVDLGNEKPVRENDS